MSALIPITMELPMVDKKPSRSYIAKAIPQGGAFLAQWAAPGLVPDWVMDGDVPQLFPTAEAAEAMAMRVLFDALNSRRRVTFKRRFTKMDGAEFAVRLANANLTPTEFAQLWGTDQDRVISWIDDMEDKGGVPFPMWWVLEFLQSPPNRDLAKAVATRHTETRNLDREVTVERVNRRR